MEGKEVSALGATPTSTNPLQRSNLTVGDRVEGKEVAGVHLEECVSGWYLGGKGM